MLSMECIECFDLCEVFHLLAWGTLIVHYVLIIPRSHMQVTPHSHGSSDSLHLSTSINSSTLAADLGSLSSDHQWPSSSSLRRGGRLEPLQSQKVISLLYGMILECLLKILFQTKVINDQTALCIMFMYER